MLQRKERNGFIHQQPGPVDQRISHVFLTDAGYAVKSPLEKVWQALEAEAFANCSVDEREL